MAGAALGALGVELLLREQPAAAALEKGAPVELVVHASTVCDDFRLQRRRPAGAMIQSF